MKLIDKQRFGFIDLARGIAIISMVFNHTGQSWLDFDFGPSAELISYLTVATAGPTFLFLAGFSLFLARSHALKKGLIKKWVSTTIKRSLGLFVIGYILNLILFDRITFLLGPLQTIGLDCVLLMPAVHFFGYPRLDSQNKNISKRQLKRQAPQSKHWPAYVFSFSLFLIGIAVYLSFMPMADWLYLYIRSHGIWGDLFFFSMPPWPWSVFFFLGAALGNQWCACKDEQETKRLLQFTGLLGSLAFISGVLAHLFLTNYDYKINFSGYSTWNPGPTNALWMTGFPPLLFIAAYQLEKIWHLPKWLLALGRHSLLIYVVHRLIIILITENLFEFTTSTMPGFLVANFALIALLSLFAMIKG